MTRGPVAQHERCLVDRHRAQAPADDFEVEPVHGCAGDDQVERPRRREEFGTLHVPADVAGVAAGQRLADVDHRLRCLDGIDVRDQWCQRASHGPFTGAEIEDPAGEAAGE